MAALRQKRPYAELEPESDVESCLNLDSFVELPSPLTAISLTQLPSYPILMKKLAPASTEEHSIFRALHSDILTIVFSHLPTLARLWSISLVCKRWCAAARRSITSVRLSAARSISSGIAICPSLTEIHITREPLSDIIPLVLPSSIRSLKLGVPGENAFRASRLRFVPPYPLLHHLDAADLTLQIDFLMHSQQTLTSLSLRGCGSFRKPQPDTVGAYLEMLRFPALVKLSVEVSFHGVPALGALISAHASQLESLRITCGCNNVDSHSTEKLFAEQFHLPRLQELVYLQSISSPLFIALLVDRCPQLRRLTVAMNVHQTAGATIRTLDARLSQPVIIEGADVAPVPFIDERPSVQVPTHGRPLPLLELHRAAALTLVSPPWASLEPWLNLPQLRRLDMELTNVSLPNWEMILLVFLRAAPSLEAISLNLIDATAPCSYQYFYHAPTLDCRCRLDLSLRSIASLLLEHVMHGKLTSITAKLHLSRYSDFAKLTEVARSGWCTLSLSDNKSPPRQPPPYSRLIPMTMR